MLGLDFTAIEFILITKWLSYGFCDYLNCKPSSIKALITHCCFQDYSEKYFPLPLSLLLSFSFLCSSHFCPILQLLSTGYFCNSISSADVTSLAPLMSPKTPDFSLCPVCFSPSLSITVLSSFFYIYEILQVPCLQKYSVKCVLIVLHK